MMHPCFFGYGSLVNTRTHAFPSARPARVRGWRRVWQATSLRPAAFLSVVPDAGTVLDGLIAEVPNADWHALDDREYAYGRHAVVVEAAEAAPPDVQVYAVRSDYAQPTGGRDHPILLSYLDVVVQGYLHQFGPSGVTRFFETTDRWDTPIRDDRARPVYPRAQQLAPDETALVDDWLARLSAVVEHG